MRTTISIDDDVLRQLKERAARTGHTLSEVVEEAARFYLAPRRSPEQKPVELVTAPGGPRPGVDLNNNAALLDLMEEGE